MKKALPGTLALLLAASCGTAPGTEDGSGSPDPVQSATLSGASSSDGKLLAELQLSPTHTVRFLEVGPNAGLINEIYNLDLDRPLLRGQKVTHGQYAEVYTKLAGSHVDAAALQRLRDFDAAADLATDGAPTSAEDAAASETDLVNGDRNVLNQSVEKATWDDVDRFRMNACGGCWGWEGNRQNFGEPSSWPVCTNAPEICLFLAAGSRFQRKVANFDIWTENFEDSGPDSEIIVAKDDPCQGVPWPRNSPILYPNGCWNDGTQVWKAVLGPRQSNGAIFTTSPRYAWKLNFYVSYQQAAIKLDYF